MVITPTEYSAAILKSYGIRRPIHAISNGIDTHFFAPSEQLRQSFRARWNITSREKVVISVGHYIQRKGILDFLEVARRMPDVRFFWFGYTNLNLIPAHVRQAIVQAPPNVTFPGFVDREGLREAYCGADAFAFLSHEETRGSLCWRPWPAGHRSCCGTSPSMRAGCKTGRTSIRDGTWISSRHCWAGCWTARCHASPQPEGRSPNSAAIPPSAPACAPSMTHSLLLPHLPRESPSAIMEPINVHWKEPHMKLEYIKVGRVVNAHGIRGDLRVQPMGQPPDFLTQFRTLYLDGSRSIRNPAGFTKAWSF